MAKKRNKGMEVEETCVLKDTDLRMWTHLDLEFRQSEELCDVYEKNLEI